MSVYDNIFAIAELFHSKAEAKKITENLINQFSLQGFQKLKVNYYLEVREEELKLLELWQVILNFYY